MAVFNWTFDSAVGVYKNNFISNELLLQSVAAMKIVPFTKPLAGFGKHKGETVNIMRLNELTDPTSIELEEGTRIPVDKLSYGNRTLTVVEMGK